MASALDLGGRTALVTGSTQGIGRASATGLASRGARIGVDGRSNRSVARAMGAIRRDVPDAGYVDAILL